ncbi:hypothetical protein B0A55_09354 [Friedmanniomyces simplex]|uniref:C4-dicarboxylate transporter/malic acid transport protein n=1 Tax=Friedmanniomyces simplex TaxID=329884 RepID=A0A4U0WQ18_9PEZI|nr:hypothetical protein B0A55_09354 [Friedmanniomyces simplex]
MDPSCSTPDVEDGRRAICADAACQQASYPEIGAAPTPSATTTDGDNNDPKDVRTSPGAAARNDTIETTATYPSKLNRGWRRIVRNFTPSWFSVTMGTGIVSTLLHNLPYSARWLSYLSYVVFALNVVLACSSAPSQWAWRLSSTCWFIAIIFWGFGLVWFAWAIATIHWTPRFPFNMGWWGFTFPLGVYATSTNTLAAELPSAFFKVLGTIFSVSVVILWIVVALGTLQRAWTGEMFFSPCLKELEEREAGAKGACGEGGKEVKGV